jgi:hypothetical protein
VGDQPGFAGAWGMGVQTPRRTFGVDGNILSLDCGSYMRYNVT